MQSDGSASETSTAASNLNEILSFLRIEVESRERSGHPATRGKEQTDETKDQSQPAASALHSAAPSAPGECLFCHSKKHETQFYDAQETLYNKKKMLGRDGRCFRCTTKGHRARDCRKRLICSSCGGRHAVIICDPSYTRTKEGAVACVSSSKPYEKRDDSCQRTIGGRLPTDI